MALILTIDNQSSVDANQITSHRFENGGTIGRSTKCDWVLYDPSRYISGIHASISQRDGVFYIMDTSSNGLYINRSETPLGKGNTSQINNGDHLRIGQFEINVDIASEEQQHSSSEIKPQSIFESSPPASGGDLGLMDILEQKDGAASAVEGAVSTPEAPFSAENSALIPQEPNASPIIPAGTFSDHAQPLEEHFSPPPAIPDNWDLSSDSQVGDAQAENSSSKAPSADSPDALKQEQKPIPPIPDVSAPQESIVATNSSTNSSTMSSTTGTQQTAQSPGDGVLLQTLLDAMGINKQELPADKVNGFVNIVGKVVRDTVAGMVTILRARAAIKSEFRMAMTTIQSQENNPLKFSVGTEEAIKNMFLNSTDSFLSPLQALHEGFEDIQAHQMAMMAGMQAALKAILKQFDPLLLEKTFEQANTNKSLPANSNIKNWDSYVEQYQELVKNLLPGNKKAKYWNAYTAHYQELMQHIEDDFQAQFGQEFTLIYEQQVARLKLAKKSRK